MTCNAESRDLTYGDEEAAIYADHRVLRCLHGIWRGKRVVSPFCISTAMTIFLFLVAVVVSLSAGVLILPGPGVGLLEHCGNLSMLIVLPLGISLLAIPVKRYRCFASHLPALLETDTGAVEKEIARLAQEAGTQKTWKWRFVICGAYLGGILFAAVNAYGTTFCPLSVYHHDVYDSVKHLPPFIWMRIFFAVFWGWLIPMGAVFWLKLILLGRRALQRVSDAQPLRLSTLVSLNRSSENLYIRFASSLLWPVLSFLIIIFALYTTHGITVTLVAGTILFVVALTVLLVCLILPYKRTFDRSLSSHFKILGDRMDAAWRAYCGEGDDVAKKSQDELKAGLRDLEELASWQGILARVPRWPMSSIEWARLALTPLSPILAAVLGKIANVLVK